MKYLFSVLALLLLFTSTTKAYDEDVHFYGIYSMARFAGFAPEIALYLATASQYMDESSITSPLEALDLNKARTIRRLYHFAVPYESYDFKIMGWGKQVPNGKVVDMTMPTFSNSLMPNQIIKYGISKQNLLVAAAGLHPLADSYSHSFHGFELGHLDRGHWTDRYYWVAGGGSNEKFEDMIGGMFKALVGIRGLIVCEDAVPLDAHCPGLDKNSPNRNLGAESLASQYLKIPKVQNLMNHFILKDPVYMRIAIDDSLRRAQENGFIFPDVDLNVIKRFVPDYSKQLGRQSDKYDAIEALKETLQNAVAYLRCNKAAPRVFNYKQLEELNIDYGDLLEDKPCGTPADKKRVEEIIVRLNLHYIPFQPGKYVTTDWETDGHITRITEMKMRDQEWRELVASQFGEGIFIDGSPDIFSAYNDPAYVPLERGPMAKILGGNEIKEWNKEFEALNNAGTAVKLLISAITGFHFSDYGLTFGRASKHAKVYQDFARAKANFCYEPPCRDDQIPFPLVKNWELQFIAAKLKPFILKGPTVSEKLQVKEN